MIPYRILHITNDYSGSTVYKNLIHELDNLGVSQIIYNPIRDKNRIGKNKIEFKDTHSKIIYRYILNYHIDRVFYPYKTWKIFKDIQRQVNLSKVDFIHAHTWYSDGGIAYLLAKKYNIPYMITIRNTDLYVFQKKLRYLHSFGKRILNKAENVVLISPSSKQKVLELSSLAHIKTELSYKLHLIPNGVDSFWINNTIKANSRAINDGLKLLYIGKFSKRKNVVALQKAIVQLNEQYEKNIKLYLVGGGREQEEEVLKLVEKHPNLFVFHGVIYDKNELLKIYRSCDVFAMPSKGETFGLVYIEAMLQGLPILYTRNEGIDGFYDEKIGEAVTIGDVSEIMEKLLLLYENYNTYKINIELLQRNHDWRLIAMKYLSLYDSIYIE